MARRELDIVIACCQCPSCSRMRRLEYIARILVIAVCLFGLSASAALALAHFALGGGLPL